MKKILTLLIATACLIATGCGTVNQTPAERKAEAARVKSQVKQRLDSRHYVIVIDNMIPLRGGSRPLTSPYSLTIDGDDIISYLPYFGVAYNVPYGGGKALNFEAGIKEYSEEAGRRDRRTITISTDNGEDFLVYTLTVFDNGKANLSVNARNREPINFQGYLDPDADPSEEKD